MFESLALENPRNTRRNCMTAVSFALQATGLGLLVLASIGYTEAIAPRFQQQIVAPMGMTNVATEPAPQRQEQSASDASVYREAPVTYIEASHNFHPRTEGRSNIQPFDPNGNYVVGAPNTTGGTIGRILAEMRPGGAVGPASANTRTKPYPISNLNPGMLIKQVQPVYPALARQTRTEGKVVLVAVIDTQGRIEDLRALSGHPFLIPAAISAVQQWRYRPFILNGQPVEVETQITVNFTLQQN